MANQVVDLQLMHNGVPVNDRYLTECDTSDPADVAGLFRDALRHARIEGEGDGYQVRVWNFSGTEELFTYPAS